MKEAPVSIDKRGRISCYECGIELVLDGIQLWFPEGSKDSFLAIGFYHRLNKCKFGGDKIVTREWAVDMALIASEVDRILVEMAARSAGT